MSGRSPGRPAAITARHRPGEPRNVLDRREQTVVEPLQGASMIPDHCLQKQMGVLRIGHPDQELLQLIAKLGDALAQQLLSLSNRCHIIKKPSTRARSSGTDERVRASSGVSRPDPAAGSCSFSDDEKVDRGSTSEPLQLLQPHLLEPNDWQSGQRAGATPCRSPPRGHAPKLWSFLAPRP